MNFTEYVEKRWKEMFETEITPLTKDTLVELVTDYQTNNTVGFETACKFITENPLLIQYKKNQVGEGEFALFLLIPSAKKTSIGQKGDLEIHGKRIELKRIKSNSEPIRFGTNNNLKSVNNFRYLTFGLSSCFSNYQSTDSVFSQMRTTYSNIIGDSDASITIPKMNSIYNFLKSVTGLQIPVNFNTESESSLYYYRFFDMINLFLTRYPDTQTFGESVVTELCEVYENSKIDLVIIDADNTVRVNPKFTYHSLNQYVRPQVVLAE
jgi:hypothetical protein